jgi:hypothetical protein
METKCLFCGEEIPTNRGCVLITQGAIHKEKFKATKGIEPVGVAHLDCLDGLNEATLENLL